ncbi:MAG: hypothetical protein MUO77_02615 [Anaerolineales bacterium]|nr:hypothetical protein [Anaerolineales bacterium]
MKNKNLYLFFLILALSSLACSIFVGGPDYPANPVPFSMEAADSFTQQVEQAMTVGAETGTFDLQINEEQLTSYLTLKMQEQASPPFTEPQILLRGGQMQIFGKIQRGYFLANTAIILSVGIDEAGLPKIEVISADFGPFPAPQGVNEAISAIVAEAFTGSFGPAAIGLRVETITIADGIMTLTGRLK